jgi:hypothetical protein
MKGLLSTGASRAWLGVAFAGLVVVLAVLALGLISRLGAGQHVIDETSPAFSDTRVAGTRAGVDLVSQYVDVLDPLLTRRGGGSRDVVALIGLMRHRMGLSSAQVHRILRREAPHTEALMRALPLNGISDELSRLTSYLAITMGMTDEQIGATLEESFPHISASLTALSNTADAWYDVPGIDGLTRVSQGKPVRTVPGLRKYYRDDLVPRIVAQRKNVQRLAGSGGVGYIPYLLLVAGLGLLALGPLKSRRAAKLAPGKLSWGLVVGVGVVLILLVAIAQYFPRLAGAQRAVTDLRPVVTQERARGALNGMDTIHEAIAFADPLMTRSGGAASEGPRLYRFIAERTGQSSRLVRREVGRRAPRLTALLDAAPLSAVAAESEHLRGYLSHVLRLPGDKLVDTLDARAPALAPLLLTLPDVATGWNAIGPAGMTLFDGVTPVRSMPDFDDYLRQDLMPVLTSEHEDVDRFASGWPPLDELAPAVLIGGIVLMLYGGLMMQFVARKY